VPVEMFSLSLLLEYDRVMVTSLNYTSWNRILLEEVTGFQLVKKFPAFYGT
jgi:hypothetical protein